MASSSKPSPAVGVAEARREVYRMPLRAASMLMEQKVMKVTRRTLMPDNSAASALPPMA